MAKLYAYTSIKTQNKDGDVEVIQPGEPIKRGQFTDEQLAHYVERGIVASYSRTSSDDSSDSTSNTRSASSSSPEETEE